MFWLPRVTNENVLVTFKKSTSALAATGLHGKDVNNHTPITCDNHAPFVRYMV